MALKTTVTKLKKKHRDYIWKDEEGDYWYYDSDEEQWCVLVCDLNVGFYTRTEFSPGHYNEFKLVAGSIFADW